MEAEVIDNKFIMLIDRHSHIIDLITVDEFIESVKSDINPNYEYIMRDFISYMSETNKRFVP